MAVSSLNNNQNDTASNDNLNRLNLSAEMISGNDVNQIYLKLQAEKQRIDAERHRLAMEAIRNQAQIDLMLQMLQQQQQQQKQH